MVRMHARGSRILFLWFFALAGLGGSGCDHATNPAPYRPLSGLFMSLGPDNRFSPEQRFENDSALLRTGLLEPLCREWDAKGKFSHGDDSMCISGASVRMREDCQTPATNWERRPDLCFAIRNVSSSSYEVLQPTGDWEGPREWIRFQRVIPE